jgi:hypothetical protein
MMTLNRTGPVLALFPAMTRPALAQAVALTVALAASAGAWATDASALMEESDKRNKVSDEVARYDMELMEGDKVRHVRKLVRLEKRGAGKSNTLVRFSEPASVRNVSLLIVDTGETTNDIWGYTPATRNLRRISGSQKQNWFMGTEFTYEDFEDYKLKQYSFTRVGVRSPCLSWSSCTIVEAKPAPGAEAAASGYLKKHYYIEAGSLFPVQVDYFDATGKLAKRLTTEGLQRHREVMRPTAQTMHNLSNDRRTRMALTAITINGGLKDAQVNQRALRDEEF